LIFDDMPSKAEKLDTK